MSRSKRRQPVKRNPMAKELQNPLYRQKIVPKKRVKKPQPEIEMDWD